MSKTIKTMFKVIATLFIGVILYLNYQTHFSKAAREGKNNIENIKKVKKGKNVNDVILIMGNPDLINYCDLDSLLKGYDYITNDDSFVYVTVCFDSTMKVEETYFPR